MLTGQLGTVATRTRTGQWCIRTSLTFGGGVSSAKPSVVPSRPLSLQRALCDLSEIGRSAKSRFALHDAWLDVLEPLGFDRAMVFDDTRLPGPASTFAGRNQRVAVFEDARRDSVRYLADYPILRKRAAATRDVLQLSPRDTWFQVYQEHGVVHGERQVLVIALHGRGKALSVITLSRDTRYSKDFTARAQELAVGLAPMLSLSDLQWARSEADEPRAYVALPSREREVAHLVRRGLTNAEIAALVGVSSNTVRNQLASIFRKLGVSTRAELAGID